MSETTRKTVDYAVACVNEFARRKGMTSRAAFLYLYQYQGLQFMQEFYDVEHTLHGGCTGRSGEHLPPERRKTAMKLYHGSNLVILRG